MDDQDRRYRDSRRSPQPRKRASSDRPRRDTAEARDAGARRRATESDRRERGTARAEQTRRAASTASRNPASARPRGDTSARPARKIQPSGQRKTRGGRAGRIWRRVLLALLALLIVAGIAGCVTINRLSADLPDLSGETILAQTSIIYDADGGVLAELHAEENRTYVSLANIPMDLRNAVIATEDERFYEHDGVDFMGIARALWVNISQGKHQGGSTITQQYVVNTFIEREDTITRKLREALLAYKLESTYSKDQILEKYLNTIYFGHGAYGVEAAAQAYFGKSVTELTTAECAMIGGAIKSPGRYSPRIDPEAAKNRRSTVLGQMLTQGYIDQATHDAADAEPFTLAQATSEADRAPYFVDWVIQTLSDMYGADAVYKGGLRVTTTLDPTAQTAAEEAIAGVLDEEGDPSAALVAIEPASGEIRALVGGQDFDTQQFNVATQGRRQPGSAFKTFVLVTALEKGISPEQTYESKAMSLSIPGGQTWKVSGASGGGLMRLRQATVKSVNSVYAQLILEVSADAVAETATRMGITTEINAVPAIALGSQEVSPLEMASAYGTLANGGTHVTPHGITEVKSASGEVLYAAAPVKTQALTASVAYLTTDMLKGVISGGTGTAAKIGRPAAGKTGTTQEYRDAWFVGYTPDLVASVWVGYPDSQVEMKNVHGIKVTGGSFPAQIWAAFMKGALVDTPKNDFERPDGLVTRTICLETGLVATEYCPETGTGLFLSGHVPGTCTEHEMPETVIVPNVIGLMKSEALALLKSLFLEYTVAEQPVPGVPSGMVSQQTPVHGSEVATGTVVSLIVSTGDPEPTAPVASFSYSPQNPKTGDEITFDGSDSTDSDGTITAWSWEFGDGSGVVTGKTVSHAFATAGTYTVTLWVTDSSDLTATSSIEITVR